MKKFLIRTSVFALIMIVVIIGLELALFLKPNELTYRTRYIHDNADRITTVVLGNSLTNNAIVPEDISDSMFNFAVQGKPHFVDKELMKRFVTDLPNLKCVIYPIGYNMQYDDPLDKDNQLIGYDYRGSLLCRMHKYWGIPVDGEPRWRHLSELLWKKGSYILDVMEENPVKCRPTGWEPSPTRYTEIIPLEEYFPDGFDYESEHAKNTRKHNLGTVSEIAEICKAHDIRLIFITTPYYSADTTALQKGGREDMHQFVKSLLEVNPKAEYYDFMFDHPYQEDDFYNAFHMNETGAHKFSKMLKDSLKL